MGYYLFLSIAPKESGLTATVPIMDGVSIGYFKKTSVSQPAFIFWMLESKERSSPEVSGIIFLAFNSLKK